MVVTLRRKRRAPSSQVSSYISRHAVFKGEMNRELDGQRVPTHFAAAYSVLRHSGREVQQRVRAVMRTRDAPLGIFVGACIRTIRLVSHGKESQAAHLLSEVPALAACASDGKVHVRRLQARLRQHLDQQIVQDHKVLEKTAIPELHKSVKRERL